MLTRPANRPTPSSVSRMFQGQPARMQIDHITIACSSLDQGRTFATQRLGAAPPMVGKHPLMGTHNLLTRISESSFLELIAIDPGANAPDRPRWFGLDTLELRERLRRAPVLVGWVARVHWLDAIAPSFGDGLGRVITVTRGNLRWRMTVHDQGLMPEGGAQPLLIEWPGFAGPAAHLPDVGIELDRLQVNGVGSQPLAQKLASHGWRAGSGSNAKVEFGAGGGPAELVATLRGPRGGLTLSSRT
jgi:catechol 2,3-dioxygenase-like lactoylglutathione lyase family enzyme